MFPFQVCDKSKSEPAFVEPEANVVSVTEIDDLAQTLFSISESRGVTVPLLKELIKRELDKAGYLNTLKCRFLI